MQVNTITRKLLREIPIGSTKTFKVPHKKKMDSARAACGWLKTYEDMQFTVHTDIVKNEIEITRLQ